MRIIPVLDLRRGQAVHAVAGDRAHYRPLRSILHAGSDVLDLARAARARLGATELYLADLDAIEGGPPSVRLYQAITRLGLTLWVDAGVTNVDDVALLTLSPRGEGLCVILGLETLASPGTLRAIMEWDEPPHFAFSLDLRDGHPLIARGADWGTTDPLSIASLAIETGIRRVILLDLARVGTGRGVGTLDLLQALRQGHPDVELIAGGGIASPEDLQALEASGASAALVGSALHDGRLDLRGRPS